MDIVREKLKRSTITLGEYRVEAILSTIEFLEDNQHYDFVREIGHGSYGVAVELKHPTKDHRVAAKIVLQEFVCKSETEIWPLLSHENVLPLISVEHIATTYSYIFISPLCPSSLCDIVKSHSLAEDINGIQRAITWFHGVCSGVDYLHTERLCHLDLKLSNVLIDDRDSAVICDFGALTRTDGPTDKLVTHFFPIKYDI